MADNAAQAIKDLKKNIDSLDISLDNALKNHEKYTQMIAKTFQDAANQGKTSIDELVAYIGKKTKQVSAEKIKLQIDLGLGKKGELEQQIASMRSDIAKYEKSKDTHSVELLKKQLKELESEYKQLADTSKKSAAQMYDDMIKIVNAAAGEKKQKSGTAWSQARATEMTKVRNTMNEINALIDKRNKLEANLAKEGRTEKYYDKQRKDIEGVNKEIDKYKRTLASLGGRGKQALAAIGGDGASAALKQQEHYFRTLNRLLNERRRLEAQIKAQGGTASEVQARYQQVLNASIKQTVASMRELGRQYKSVTQEAAQNTMVERMRRTKTTIDQINGSLKQTKQEVTSMIPSLQRLASAFGIAFSVRGLAQFGKKLIETRGEFELQQVALRSILQNKQLADEIWDKTMRAALQSPYTAMQLTKYTKQLAAYRIETEKLFDTTKRLADVSAGLGVDMQRLILAYGQVKAANYLRASEIRQFTEAGVNILGELSTYLSRMKGEAISTAQVMEMVQKRMVTFADVEAIFKRMTDQGGIFYNMQYIQSQTIKGQMMKLKDAFDQMLNSIGQGNEGVIKDLIALLNNIVKNWREWKTVIDAVAFPALTVAVIKFSKGLFAANAAALATDKSFAILTRAGARLNVQLKALSVTLKAHPLFLIASVIFTVTRALINHANAVKATNREYDELNKRIFDTQDKMASYKSRIEKNNAILQDTTKSEKEHNKAQSENAEILSELKRDYPDVANGMTQAENGIVAMTKSMEAYNAQLRLQIKLNERSKAAFFDESAQKDAQQLDESINKSQIKLLEYTEQARRAYMKLQAFVAEGTNVGLDKAQMQEAIKRLQKIAAAKTIEEYENALAAYSMENVVNIGLPQLQSYESALSKRGLGRDFNFRTIDKGWRIENRRAELKNELKDDYKYFGDYLRDIALLTGKFEDNLMLTTEGFIDANREAIQGMLYNIGKDGEVAIGELGYDLSQQFLKAASDLSQTEEGRKTIIDEFIRQFAEFYGLDVKFGTRTPIEHREEDAEANREAFSKMIPLIKEMRAEYDKLSKSAYGYAKSEDEVRKAYEKAVREILGKAGVSTNYDFTTNTGMISALKKVQDFAKTLKDGDELAKQVEKIISSLNAEIGINVEVRNREDFAREIEQMFSDYELTLELQKLNISPSAAKNLFPELDYKTMGDLQDRMRRFYQEQVAAGGFDEKDLETYRKFADKIDAEILKERKERAKQYSKFLEQEYSERAKVEMQYAQDVAFVSTNFKDAQRENILKGLEQKFSKDISELNWKSFKESDFYLDMMEDLSSLPKDYLDKMLEKIEQVLTENKDGLSPRTLKEIVKARQRVLDAQIKLRPLDVMRSSIEGIRAASKDETVGGGTWRATNKNLKENIKLQADQIAQFDKEILSLQKLQGELAGYEDLTARFKAISSSIDLGVLNSLLGLGEDKSINDVGTMEISNITALIERLTAGLAAAKEAYDPTQKTDEMNKLAVEISQREIMIKLLGEELEIRREISEYQLSPQAMKAMTQGQTSAGIGAQISEEEGKKETTEKRQLKFKEWLKSFDNFGEAYKELNKNINNTITSVANAGSAFYDMFDALGGETDALTEGWKEFGSTMINTITQALTMIPTMVAAFVTAGTAINAALGIIGLIAEALQLLFVAIGAIAKLHDSQYEKEIEEQQKRIDELKRAYDRLEKSIEKTWDTMSYIRDYNDMIDSLEQQRDALNKQIAAEEKKKDTDSDKLQGYKDSIQEIDDQLEDLKQKQLEVFGGIGKVNYRSVAQEFVDAWKDAFLETGDGLQGLKDHFDEFLNEWFVKQATMRIAGRMLAPLFEDIDEAVDESSLGGTSVLLSELQRVREKFATIAPQLSDALEQLAGMWGLGEGEGSLSGLAAGIQGMTEEQANVLEAYWNSVRSYTASIDMNVSRIADMLGAGSRDITNPQLQQLQLIAANAQATHQLLLSTSKSGHPMGGYGFKVFND